MVPWNPDEGAPRKRFLLPRSTVAGVSSVGENLGRKHCHPRNASFTLCFLRVFSATNAEGWDAVATAIAASATRSAAPTASSPTKATALTPEKPRVSSRTVSCSQVAMIGRAGPTAGGRLDPLVHTCYAKYQTIATSII